MKKVLIIEDDIFSARHLTKLLRNIDDTIEVHGPLSSVEEVIDELCSNNDYDLIFSDIRLVDGDVFDAFSEVMPQAFVIFTTAYDEYAMQAIKNNGLDYLMKPIDGKELLQAIGKLKLSDAADADANLVKLDRMLSDSHHYRKRFLVNKGDELIMVDANKINYISMDNGKVNAHIDGSSCFSLPVTMAELETQLDPEEFFRLNRQYIANIKGIRKISLSFNSKLIIRLKGLDNEEIVVSKEKTAQLKRWLDQ